MSKATYDQLFDFAERIERQRDSLLQWVTKSGLSFDGRKELRALLKDIEKTPTTLIFALKGGKHEVS